MIVKNFNEAGHVGALELMGQEHEHAKRGYGVLLTVGAIFDYNRMPDVFDTDFVNCEFTCICGSLNIGDRRNRVSCGFTIHYLILIQVLFALLQLAERVMHEADIDGMVITE
jgi:hypothetical protein